MEILHSTINDLNNIMNIYDIAKDFMKKNNNPTQWKDDYPSKDLIINDINNNKSYKIVENNQILGVFYLDYDIEAEKSYNKVDGKGFSIDKNKPYAVIHRIASSGQKKGIAKFCFDFVYQKYKPVLIDTHKNNLIMQNTLTKNGFNYVGIIHLVDYHNEERLAYEKI